MAAPAKILKIIRPHGDALDILTRMSDEAIVKEIELGDAPTELEDALAMDTTWVRIAGLNALDEQVVTAVMREDIRAYLILPYHPEQQRPQNQVMRPGLMQ